MSDVRTDVRTGFMCGVDFQHHLGEDVVPTRVYPDVETLREQRKCVAECGIVEVEVRLVSWVQDQDFDRPAALAARVAPPPSPLDSHQEQK